MIKRDTKKIKYWCKILSLPFAYFLIFAMPFVSFYFGNVYKGSFVELFIYTLFILSMSILSHLIRNTAKKYNYGESIPVPKKRFTYVDDGQIMIDNFRLMDMIKYLSEVEDYLERQGLL